MDQLGLGRDQIARAGSAIIETGADGNDAIGPAQDQVGGIFPMHPGQTETGPVRGRKDPLGHEGHNGRDAGLVCKIPCEGGGACMPNPAAHREHRPAGGIDHGRGPRNTPGMGPGGCASFPGRWPPLNDCRLELHIPGHIDQHRTLAAGGRQGKGMRDQVRQLTGLAHAHGVFGETGHHPADIDLLEGIRADEGAGDLTGDGDQGHRVPVGVGNGGHEIGGARARGGQADCRTPRRACHALGDKGRSLLMAGQDMADAPP